MLGQLDHINSSSQAKVIGHRLGQEFGCTLQLNAVLLLVAASECDQTKVVGAILSEGFCSLYYSVPTKCKYHILLHTFNYTSKTQVSITTRTTRSQLSPIK